jgi:hypothetical protein
MLIAAAELVYFRDSTQGRSFADSKSLNSLRLFPLRDRRCIVESA